jgi:hypothetical protein
MVARSFKPARRGPPENHVNGYGTSKLTQTTVPKEGSGVKEFVSLHRARRSPFQSFGSFRQSLQHDARETSDDGDLSQCLDPATVFSHVPLVVRDEMNLDLGARLVSCRL